MATQFHTGGDANNHQAIFAHYAVDGIWSSVHVGQFAGMAMLLAGLIGLGFVLERDSGRAKWLIRGGAAATAATLALYGALQAVDGVALKQVVMAWVSAPEAEKAARFATAESIRWLEWGMRSYQDFMLALALLLFASVIATTKSVPRIIALLMALSAFAYLAQGWIAGTEGFSSAQSIAIVASWVFGLSWMIWLAIVAERLNEGQATTIAGGRAAAL
ncbi:hypothetical protein PSQ19_13635 [Devosia algicola]|uniref:DUF4386 family protein n=1 Tax=Devosia algicola TaxID=3026418 RepID=A0ABY7YKF1_9HYPH|nr:DUF4386 family protein [Devosia algicola]WDR01769.1 hypothetical protein PSQ19_13635 [Devosia algicola]